MMAHDMLGQISRVIGLDNAAAVLAEMQCAEALDTATTMSLIDRVRPPNVAVIRQLLLLGGAGVVVMDDQIGLGQAVSQMGSPLRALRTFGRDVVLATLQSADAHTPQADWLGERCKDKGARVVLRAFRKKPLNDETDEYIPWREVEGLGGAPWVMVRAFLLHRAPQDNRASRLLQVRCDPVAAAGLREQLEHVGGVPRLHLLGALAAYDGDESAIAELLVALHGPDQRALQAALIACQRLSEPRLMARADELLDSPVHRVRGTAFDALFRQLKLSNDDVGGSFSDAFKAIMRDEGGEVRRVRERIRRLLNDRRG